MCDRSRVVSVFLAGPRLIQGDNEAWHIHLLDGTGGLGIVLSWFSPLLLWRATLTPPWHPQELTVQQNVSRL